jgi:hypothetical protein
VGRSVVELIRRGLAARNDPREVIADPESRYFGAKLSERMLVSSGDARLGETRFDAWLSQSTSEIPSAKPQPAVAAVLTNQ